MNQSFNPSVDPQAAHPAVGINFEAHVRSHARVHYFIKIMPRVRLEFSAREHGLPHERSILQSLERHIDAMTTLERAALGKVAFEPGSVDFQPLNAPWRSQPDDGPIVARPAASFCLPAVTHVRGASGHD